MSSVELETKEYFSPEEIRNMIEELNDIELTLAFDIAEQSCWSYKLDYEDIALAVIERILRCNDKTWPKDMTFIQVFRKLCRSVISNQLRKENCIESISLNTVNQSEDELINTISDNDISSELKLEMEEQLTNLLKLFSDDEVAQELIKARIDNFAKKEILELLDLTDVEYESKWTKIRRILKNTQGKVFYE